MGNIQFNVWKKREIPEPTFTSAELVMCMEVLMFHEDPRPLHMETIIIEKLGWGEDWLTNGEPAWYDQDSWVRDTPEYKKEALLNIAMVLAVGGVECTEENYLALKVAARLEGK